MFYLFGLAEPCLGWRGKIVHNNVPLEVHEYRDMAILYAKTEERGAKPDTEKLRIHNSILLECMDAATVLPFSYGCLVKSLDEVMRFIDHQYLILQELFQTCRGKVELGLKILVDLPNKLQSKYEFKTGTDYMCDLTNNHRRRQKQFQDARQTLDALVANFTQVFSRRVYQWPETGIVLCDAAYLVDRGNWDTAEALVRTHFSGHPIKYQLSGPWPPYSFMTALTERSRSGG